MAVLEMSEAAVPADHIPKPGLYHMTHIAKSPLVY